MTKIEANIPDYLARQARAVAERERIPLDQIIALARKNPKQKCDNSYNSLTYYRIFEIIRLVLRCLKRRSFFIRKQMERLQSWPG